jgi:hypothetical protein
MASPQCCYPERAHTLGNELESWDRLIGEVHSEGMIRQRTYVVGHFTSPAPMYTGAEKGMAFGEMT